MSGSTRAAEPGTGATEIAAEPQSPLPNLPPLLTEVQGQVCGVGGIFQNENTVYKDDLLIFNEKVLLGWVFKLKPKSLQIICRYTCRLKSGESYGTFGEDSYVVLKGRKGSDGRAFPGLHTAVQKLGSQGTGRE